jgi:hypothetical protein
MKGIPFQLACIFNQVKLGCIWFSNLNQIELGRIWFSNLNQIVLGYISKLLTVEDKSKVSGVYIT